MVNHRDTKEKLTSMSRSMTTSLLQESTRNAFPGSHKDRLPSQRGFDGGETSSENQQLTISDTSGTSVHCGDHRKEQMLEYDTDGDDLQYLYTNKNTSNNIKAPPAKRKRVSDYFGDDTVTSSTDNRASFSSGARPDVFGAPFAVPPKQFRFTKEQLQFLTDNFTHNRRPSTAEMHEWADNIGVRRDRVRTWFTNKRNHTRKVMSLENATPILREYLRRNPRFTDYSNVDLRDRLGWTRDMIAHWFAKARGEQVSRTFQNYSEESLQVLTRSFEANQNPSQDEMKRLAGQTGLYLHYIRRWFSSKRQTESMGSNKFNGDDEIWCSNVVSNIRDTASPDFHRVVPIQLQDRRLPTTHKNSQDGVRVEVDNIRVHNLQMVNEVAGIHPQNAPLDTVGPTPDNQRRRVDLHQARTHRFKPQFQNIPLPFNKNRNWATWTNQEVLEFGYQFLNSEAMSNLSIGKIVGSELAKFVDTDISLLEAFKITIAEAVKIQEFLTTMTA